MMEEENQNRDVFEISDLTEELLGKVWYVEQVRTGGLGGPGNILMVTEEKEEYLLA